MLYVYIVSLELQSIRSVRSRETIQTRCSFCVISIFECPCRFGGVPSAQTLKCTAVYLHTDFFLCRTVEKKKRFKIYHPIVTSEFRYRCKSIKSFWCEPLFDAQSVPIFIPSACTLFHYANALFLFIPRATSPPTTLAVSNRIHLPCT